MIYSQYYTNYPKSNSSRRNNDAIILYKYNKYNRAEAQEIDLVQFEKYVFHKIDNIIDFVFGLYTFNFFIF